MKNKIWSLIFQADNKLSKIKPLFQEVRLVFIALILLAPVVIMAKSYISDEYIPVTNVIAAIVFIVCVYQLRPK